MSTPEERKVPPQMSEFITMLENEPEAVRQSLSFRTPQQIEALKPFLRAITHTFEPNNAHFPDVMRQYLGKIASNATVLVLGSGPGTELPQIRKVVPEGRIIAIDNRVIGATVATEILADAEFKKMDLTQVSHEELLEEIGEMPDVVISRHPNVGSNYWWSLGLTLWGFYMRMSGGKLLVTTYLDTEQKEIVKAMNAFGLNPKTGEYLFGTPVPVDNFPDVRLDKFVIALK